MELAIVGAALAGVIYYEMTRKKTDTGGNNTTDPSQLTDDQKAAIATINTANAAAIAALGPVTNPVAPPAISTEVPNQIGAIACSKPGNFWVPGIITPWGAADDSIVSNYKLSDNDKAYNFVGNSMPFYFRQTAKGCLP